MTEISKKKLPIKVLHAYQEETELQLLRQKCEQYKMRLGKHQEISQLAETLMVKVIPVLKDEFHFKFCKSAEFLLEKIQNL